VKKALLVPENTVSQRSFGRRRRKNVAPPAPSNWSTSQITYLPLILPKTHILSATLSSPHARSIPLRCVLFLGATKHGRRHSSMDPRAPGRSNGDWVLETNRSGGAQADPSVEQEVQCRGGSWLEGPPVVGMSSLLTGASGGCAGGGLGAGAGTGPLAWPWSSTPRPAPRGWARLWAAAHRRARP